MKMTDRSMNRFLDAAERYTTGVRKLKPTDKVGSTEALAWTAEKCAMELIKSMVARMGEEMEAGGRQAAAAVWNEERHYWARQYLVNLMVADGETAYGGLGALGPDGMSI